MCSTAPPAGLNSPRETKIEDIATISARSITAIPFTKEKGTPTYRYYYRDVEKVAIEEKNTVVFYFDKNSQNRELPFILGELPVLSKAWWEKRDFSKNR